MTVLVIKLNSQEEIDEVLKERDKLVANKRGEYRQTKAAQVEEQGYSTIACLSRSIYPINSEELSDSNNIF